MMSDRLLVGTRKGLADVRRGADGDWAVHGFEFAGGPVVAVVRDPRDSATYATFDHGHFGVKLHRRDSDDAPWTEITTPSYPPKPEALDEREPMGQTVIPWNTEYAWVIEPGHADEPGVMWCGTIPGGLFRSDDRGETWSINEALWYHEKRPGWFGGGFNLPGIHSISIDPRNAATMVLGVSCGGGWRTDDGGASWRVATGMRANYLPPSEEDDPYTQDPHRVVRCDAAPDVLWVQHHCGIFRSTDGGFTYSEITDVAPSNFGFAVAVHPTDPDTAWFVPAISDMVRVPVDGKLVVTRTRDGGRSFEQVGAGLPADHAYDLIYRHGLAVDATGERLAMGSTTGSLWVSEDGADTMTLVSANLPPISCVTFV